MTESEPPAYAKGPSPQPYTADAGTASSLGLRITLGGMPLSDAFEIDLPDVDLDVNLGDLLDRVFGPDGARDETVLDLLDTRRNPDLPEMYADLLDVFDDRRDGRCSLRMYRNHGPEIASTDDLAQHLSGVDGSLAPLLDVVVEHRHTPLEYAADRWYGDDRALLVRRLQEHVMLHFIGRLGHDLAEPGATAEASLLSIADRLVEQGVIAADVDGGYSSTEGGEDLLDLADAEVESSVSLYDIFADVAQHDDPIEFGGGSGSDLRVDVYEAEGIDAAEAVLQRQLHDGALDDMDADWREAILDDEFFGELLIDLVDRERVDPDALEQIIEAGFAHLEEAREREEREARRRRIESQARRR